ncbi:glucose transporter, partial [Thraustotheca clavata]
MATTAIPSPPVHADRPTEPSTATNNEDAYIAIRNSPKDTGLEQPRASTSWRASRRSTSRVRLSRLESMMHEEHAKALIPAPILWVTIVVALMGSFQFGWLLSQLNFRPFNNGCAAKAIEEGTCIMFPHHSGNEWTMAVSGWILGGAIGAMGSGAPADKFGRQKTIMMNAIIMVVGGIVEAVSSEIYLFSVGRVISGIASGAAINVCNVLISEISPTNMRGMFSTGLQVGVAFGSLAVTTVHYFVGLGSGWRILVGFPIVLGIAQFLLIPFTSKSPVWLVAHGHHDLAHKELKRLYRPCNTEAILNAMIAAHEEEVKETAGINTWAALFSKKYRKQLIIAIVLCSAQQLCGINAVMYY